MTRPGGDDANSAALEVVGHQLLSARAVGGAVSRLDTGRRRPSLMLLPLAPTYRVTPGAVFGAPEVDDGRIVLGPHRANGRATVPPTRRPGVAAALATRWPRWSGRAREGRAEGTGSSGRTGEQMHLRASGMGQG